MRNYVRYMIDLEEPVKLGTLGNQNSSGCLSYIAGSSLRGALIGKYIRTYCGHIHEHISKNPELSSVLLKDTCFYNAYIAAGDKAQMPVPMVYYADKHAIRRSRRRAGETGVDELEVHSCAGLDDKPSEGEQRIGSGSYCSLREDTVATVTVEKEANLHIAIGGNKDERRMFRYEAIAAGQIFVGLIRCADEKAAEQYRALIDNEIFYIGGSRGSGYGRCHMKDARLMTAQEALGEYRGARMNESGRLLVYALSDLVLLDENGSPTGSISLSLLERKLGLRNVVLKQAFVATDTTVGFNHTWRARQVQQTSVKAGSVFVFACDGLPQEEKMQAMEEQGIGLRRTEGYGQILLNLPLGQTRAIGKIADRIMDSRTALRPEEEETLQNIFGHIYEARNDAALERAAYRIANASRDVLKDFSMAQIGRLYGLLYDQIVIGQRPEGVQKQTIKDFAETGIRGRTKDAYTLASLNLGDCGRRTMRDMLLELVNDAVSVQSWDSRFVPEGGEACKQSVYQLKGKLLQQILYNLMRMEGGKE